MIILPEDGHINIFWDDYSTRRQTHLNLFWFMIILLEDSHIETSSGIWLFYQKTAIFKPLLGCYYSNRRQPSYKLLPLDFFPINSTNELWRHPLPSWCFVFLITYSPLLTTCAICRNMNELCTLSTQCKFCFVLFTN